MFKSVSPVLPVVDMAESLAFWQGLGFQVVFVDPSGGSDEEYLVIRRAEMVLHLQRFAPADKTATQGIAVRIEMTSRDALEALYAEWQPLEVISAPLKDQPWGNYEFGFYAPDGTAFFFFVECDAA